MSIKSVTPLNKATIWVPATPATRNIAHAFVADITRLSGGITSHDGDGLYLSAEGDIIADSVKVLTVYFPDEGEEVITRFYQFAEELIEVGEEAVLLDIDIRTCPTGRLINTR